MSKKKIIVSKAIDNTISSIALGLSFVVLGVLLSYPTSSNLSAFLNPVLGYFLLLIGVTGLFLSFKDETSTIKVKPARSKAHQMWGQEFLYLE